MKRKTVRPLIFAGTDFSHILIHLFNLSLAPETSFNNWVFLMGNGLLMGDNDRVKQNLPVPAGRGIVIAIVHCISQLNNALLLLQSAPIEVQFLEEVVTADSPLVVELEHAREEVLVEHPGLGGHGYSPLLQHLKIRLHCHAFIAGVSCKHLVQHDSNGPNIALLGVGVVLVGLWRHVLGGAYVVKDLGLVGDLFHLAIAEVDYGHLFALAGVPLEENVVRLQVPVDNLPRLYVLVAVDDLLEDVEGLILGKAVGVLLDVVS